MKHAAEFLAIWFLADIVIVGLWALLCIRDDRTRGSEPVGFRSGGEVDVINHREVIRHDRA